MISLSEVGGLYHSIPPNLKDARTEAFAYACDKQIKKLLEYAEKAKVWCAVDKVDEKFLDYLAADCRALFYEPSLDSVAKRGLITNSQYWHMKLGTTDAMKEILQAVFHGNETAVEEWFEYGGDPGHFRVRISIGEIPIKKKAFSMFMGMLEAIKRKGAVLDWVEADVSAEAPVSIKVEGHIAFICFFYPRNNILPFCLDGTAALDGQYLLNGYREGKQVDFYPVFMEITQAARVVCVWHEEMVVFTEAKAFAETGEELSIAGGAASHAEAAGGIQVTGGVEVDLD